MAEVQQPSLRSSYYFLAILVLIVASYFVWQVNNLGGQTWNYDEGVWAMEARLLNQGYKLYQEIFLPAPPLFVVAIAIGFKLFGESMETARLISLILASTGLLAVGLIGRHIYGWGAGIVAVILLAIAPDFYLYSRVHNGTLASLSIFMWSILFGLYYYSSGKARWLYLAGLLAAVSLLLKFVPFFLLPVLGFTIVLRHFTSGQNRAQQLKSLALDFARVAAPFLAAVLVCLILFDARALVSQVFLHYLSGYQGMETADLVLPIDLLPPLFLSIVKMLISQGALHWPPAIRGNVSYILVNCPGLTLLGLFGIYQLRHKASYMIFACFWLLSTVLMAFIYKPMFSHLYAIYLYPLSLLAGISVARFVRLIADLARSKPSWAILETAVLTLLIAVYLYGLVYVFNYIRLNVRAPENPHVTEAIDIVRQSTSKSDWVISDLQSIAFSADRNVPPPLAETSSMRFKNQGLTLKQMKQWTTEYSPKIIVIGRVLRDVSKYDDWLEKSYSVIYDSRERQRLLIYKRNE